VTRQDVAFTSDGVTCRGWFYPAAGASASGVPGPCVVMAHGLAAVKELRLDAYAERFAAAGLHVLVFDYRHFGASDGQPRQLLDVRRQHEDWVNAVAWARDRPEVDPSRIGLWGSSFSGGHVMAVARKVEPAAVVSQVPHVSGPRSVKELGPRQVLRLTVHGLRDVARAARGRAPHYVPAAGRPGEVAIMTAPEAMEYHDLVPEGLAFDDRVAARLALTVAFYSPGRSLRHVPAPVLVQVGLRDQITPPLAAAALADKAPPARLSCYDVGHFAPYTGETFETFVAEQTAFLTEHLT
jgi:dienelactone hydrolase